MQPSQTDAQTVQQTEGGGAVASSAVLDADEDICGLCGEPGADKYAHPMHWPGEPVPDGPLVHATCEEAECRRAHQAFWNRVGEKGVREFLRSI
jgi:hypothetical protein